MKISLQYFLAFTFLVSFMNLKSQVLQNKTVKLDNFGIVSIPKTLDTIGQRIIKNVIIDRLINNSDHSNDSTLSKNYKITLTKSYFTEYANDIIVFWPSSTIAYLKSFSTTPSQSVDLNKLEVLPHASFKNVESKISSADFQKIILSSVSSIENYRELVKTSYQDLLKLLFPNNVINNITVNFSHYKNLYPVMIINTEYSFLDENNNKVTLIQHIFSILKEKTQYLAQFEYYKEDEDKWKLFISDFLSQINLN